MNYVVHGTLRRYDFLRNLKEICRDFTNQVKTGDVKTYAITGFFPKRFTYISSFDAVNTLSPKDQVYFIPGISFPRDRFRDWGKDKDIKIRRKIDIANKFVVDLKMIKTVIGAARISKIIEVFCKETNTHFRVLVKNAPYSLDRDSLDRISKELGESYFITKATNFHDLTDPFYVNKKEMEHFLNFVEILFSKGSNNFVSKSYLNKVCNNDQVITYEKYIKLWKLSEKGGTTEINMVLNSLSNVDFGPSYLYIAALHAKYRHYFECSPSWNTVRIKALRDYIHEYQGYRRAYMRDTADDVLTRCYFNLSTHKAREPEKYKNIELNIDPDVLNRKIIEVVSEGLDGFKSKLLFFCKHVNLSIDLSLRDIYEENLGKELIKLKSDQELDLNAAEKIKITEVE